MGTLLNRRRYMGGKAGIDYSKQYLTFEAVESGTFKNSLNNIDYSLDGANTWNTLTANTDSPTVSAGEKIMWRAVLTPTSNNGCGTFSSTGEFNVFGNPMSLHYGENFTNYTSYKSNAFRNLFNGASKLISAENLKLIALSVVGKAYQSMFYGCTSLIAAPEIPVISLGLDSMNSMFYNCSSLTVAPEIKVTSMNAYSMNSMFRGCVSLVQAPSVLPASSVGANGYSGMFRDCRNIEIAPVIMADSTYGMSDMFRGCAKLRYIKAMFTTAPNASNWVNGVASSGVFVKSSEATWEDTFGANAIPTGWTVQTASE